MEIKKRFDIRERRDKKKILHVYGKGQNNEKLCGEHQIRMNEKCRRMKNWKNDKKNGKEEFYGRNIVRKIV